MKPDKRSCPASLTQNVIGAIQEVSNILGAGFSEKLYERALLRELNLRDIHASTQTSFTVNYKGQKIDEYSAAIVVEDVLAVQLKSVDRRADAHLPECGNFLKASGLGVCLLVNFQKPKVEWKQFINEQ